VVGAGGQRAVERLAGLVHRAVDGERDGVGLVRHGDRGLAGRPRLDHAALVGGAALACIHVGEEHLHPREVGGEAAERLLDLRADARREVVVARRVVAVDLDLHRNLLGLPPANAGGGRKLRRAAFRAMVAPAAKGASAMRNEEEIWRLVDARRDRYVELSDRIWGMPELCYDEHRSCAEHAAMLEAEGFRITKEVAGIPTAVMGEAGEGGPVIAILGEYDACPGLQPGSRRDRARPGARRDARPWLRPQPARLRRA
jgi:hypothetical protein